MRSRCSFAVINCLKPVVGVNQERDGSVERRSVYEQLIEVTSVSSLGPVLVLDVPNGNVWRVVDNDVRVGSAYV